MGRTLGLEHAENENLDDLSRLPFSSIAITSDPGCSRRKGGPVQRGGGSGDAAAPVTDGDTGKMRKADGGTARTCRGNNPSKAPNSLGGRDD